MSKEFVIDSVFQKVYNIPPNATSHILEAVLHDRGVKQRVVEGFWLERARVELKVVPF